MEYIGKLASNYTSKVIMLPSASKGVSIKFLDKCINILYNKEGLNGIKGRTKLQNIESLFIHQS